jgi:hypothetical protein
VIGSTNSPVERHRETRRRIDMQDGPAIARKQGVSRTIARENGCSWAHSPRSASFARWARLIRSLSCTFSVGVGCFRVKHLQELLGLWLVPLAGHARSGRGRGRGRKLGRAGRRSEGGFLARAHLPRPAVTSRTRGPMTVAACRKTRGLSRWLDSPDRHGRCCSAGAYLALAGPLTVAGTTLGTHGFRNLWVLK